MMILDFHLELFVVAVGEIARDPQHQLIVTQGRQIVTHAIALPWGEC
jgi:hypothetical protein